MDEETVLGCILIDMPVTMHHHHFDPHGEHMIRFWRYLVGESRVHDCRRLVNLHLFHLKIAVEFGYLRHAANNLSSGCVSLSNL